MQNTVTLKNIALKLGVSISTVSKALNDSHEISGKTKRKIIHTAKALNYKPNFYAKNLKKREKFILGVILPSLKDPFYLNLLTGITEESCKKGHLIMVYQTENKLEREIEYTKLLSKYVIDGLIYSATPHNQENERLQELISEKILPVEIISKKKLKKKTNYLDDKSLTESNLGRNIILKIINKINYQ